jgi:hypothetical protein
VGLNSLSRRQPAAGAHSKPDIYSAHLLRGVNRTTTQPSQLSREVSLPLRGASAESAALEARRRDAAEALFREVVRQAAGFV